MYFICCILLLVSIVAHLISWAIWIKAKVLLKQVEEVGHNIEKLIRNLRKLQRGG